MLVTRKHIAYTNSSYTTIYWQGVVDTDVQCGESYSSAWSAFDATKYWKVEYSYTDLPVGSVITVDGSSYPVSGSGVVTHVVGRPTSGSYATGSLLCGSVSSCSDHSDCEKGEKCVDGECVPCDKIVDGKGVVTLWAVKPIDGSILTDGLSVDISSGVASVVSDLLAPTVGRIQIFNGMSGTLTVKAGIGILGSDFGANVTPFSGSIS